MDLEDNTRDEQGRTPEQALRERERAVEMREMRLAARQALRDRALPKCSAAGPPWLVLLKLEPR